MASLRASENSEQTVHRLEKDKKYKASLRASETSEQTLRDVSNTESTEYAQEQLKKQVMCLYSKLLCHFILISGMDLILFAHVANV